MLKQNNFKSDFFDLMVKHNITNINITDEGGIEVFNKDGFMDDINDIDVVHMLENKKFLEDNKLHLGDFVNLKNVIYNVDTKYQVLQMYNYYFVGEYFEDGKFKKDLFEYRYIKRILK